MSASDLHVHNDETSPPISDGSASGVSESEAFRREMFRSRVESTHELLDLGHLGLGDVYHSLHPGLLQQQLDHSLDALQTDYIDTYLLHNPEHYLQYKQMLDKAGLSSKRKSSSSSAQSASTSTSPPAPTLPDPSTFPDFEEKLLEAFIVLEDAVKEGKIKSYGISSNWLAYASGSQDLNYKNWIDLAETAYRTVNPENGRNAQIVDKTRRSAFRVLQFPGNLLETHGVESVARWAKQNGLETMVNRPLDALDSNGHQWRLATYKGIPNSVYTTMMNETLEYFRRYAKESPSSASAEKNAKFMTTLISDLDRERFQFQSVYHYQQDFSAQIMPMLIERMSMMQDAKALEAIQTFLEVYELNVREHCSITAEEHIASIYKGKYNASSTPLQEFALKYLLENENVDIVLNGMTRTSYVEEALKVLKL